LLKKKRREVSESFSGSSRRRLIKEDPWTVCVMREGLRPVHPAYLVTVACSSIPDARSSDNEKRKMDHEL